MTRRLDGVVQPPQDILFIKFEIGNVCHVLSEGLSCHCQLRAVNQLCVLEEVFEDGWDAPDAVDVFHVVSAGWPGIRHVG